MYYKLLLLIWKSEREFWFSHILDHESSTTHCMAMMNIPYESLFLIESVSILKKILSLVFFFDVHCSIEIQ